MKGYNTIYYLLFVILIMGAFASMAQNRYGLKILGGVAIAFGILFFVQFINSLISSGKKDVYSSVELCSLSILALIFALRVFYINFSYTEIIFGLASLILILVYSRKMIVNFTLFSMKNNLLCVIIVVFYLAIVFYFISLGSIAFFPQASQVTGITAFIFLITFVTGGFIGRNFLIDGENLSAFTVVTRRNDNSILIISLFLLFTLYRGFTMTGVLPRIYSDEFPQAYFELVNKAESGKEQPVDSKYKYQEFKKQYDQFVEHSQ
jgi:hypothetical protein